VVALLLPWQWYPDGTSDWAASYAPFGVPIVALLLVTAVVAVLWDRAGSHTGLAAACFGAALVAAVCLVLVGRMASMEGEFAHLIDLRRLESGMLFAFSNTLRTRAVYDPAWLGGRWAWWWRFITPAPYCAAGGLLLAAWWGQRARLTTTLRSWPVLGLTAGAVVAVAWVGAGAVSEGQLRQAIVSDDRPSAATWASLLSVVEPGVDQAPAYQLDLGWLNEVSAPGSPQAQFYQVVMLDNFKLTAQATVLALGIRNTGMPALPYNLLLTKALANDPGNAGAVERLRALNPTDPYLLYLEGSLLQRSGDWLGAATAYELVAAASHDPEIKSSYLTRAALSYLQRGEPAAARTDVLRAVGLDWEYRNIQARQLASGLY
jgi:hypothetical protein